MFVAIVISDPTLVIAFMILILKIVEATRSNSAGPGFGAGTPDPL